MISPVETPSPVALNPYLSIALTNIPRILGLCDREPTSRTYGCCDRYYWNYKLLDIPNARFQEVCWLLALLYRYPLGGQNPYYQNPNVLGWIQGMLDYWLKTRNDDGSVNEVYPYERSFCATAFSTMAATETLLLLEGKVSLDLKALSKTGCWLMTHDNPDLANQMASSLVSLRNLFLLTGNPAFKQAAEERKARILNAQTPLGYYPEYGGMDIGYLTITLSAMAVYLDRTEDADLRASANRATVLLDPLVHEDGRYDNSQTSRKTQYLYPYGLAVFHPGLLKRHEAGLRANRVLNPLWMDDRYCIALTTDYVLTALRASQNTENATGGTAIC